MVGTAQLAAVNAGGDFAQQLADLAFQTAHASLARVAFDDGQQRVVAERDVGRIQAVALELPSHQVVAGDEQLFLERVAVELDDLHAIEQRSRNRVHDVRRRNEQHV